MGGGWYVWHLGLSESRRQDMWRAAPTLRTAAKADPSAFLYRKCMRDGVGWGVRMAPGTESQGGRTEPVGSSAHLENDRQG